MKIEAELVYKMRSHVGEGPVWNDKTKSLFWVDIEAGTLCEHRPDEVSAESEQTAIPSWSFGQRLGFAVLAKNGRFVLGLESGFYFFDPRKVPRVSGRQTGADVLGAPKIGPSKHPSQTLKPADSLAGLTPIFDPETGKVQNRFNDGKVDALGRLWAGSMNINGPRKPEAALYRLDTDLSVRKMIDGVTVSNGLAWSPDNSEFYYIDTPTHQVRAYAFDLKSGSLGASRLAVDLSDAPGVPDGMCVDAQGMLWVAEWGGFRLCRWNPKTGKLLQKVPLPVERVSSCAFGGPDYADLYITTATSGMKEPDYKNQPLAGSLFRLRPEVPGLKCFEFEA